MQLVILFVISILISSCKTTEPKITYCVYEGSENLYCIWTRGDDAEFSRKIEIGDICTSAEDFGEAKKHHDEIHEKLGE